MQQSGGLLLAAGLDGGNTSIFFRKKRKKMQTSPFWRTRTDPFGGLFFFVFLDSNIKAEKAPLSREGWG